MSALVSSLFAGNGDLGTVADGGRTIQAPESSDSVSLIQQALASLGFELPEAGADGIFGAETGTAVSAFKADRVILPSNPIVGRGTIGGLDRELSFLEGVDDPAFAGDRALLAREPFTAGVLDALHPDLGIAQKVLEILELGDEFCFSMSMAVLDAPLLASFVGRYVEPRIAADFCLSAGPCSPVDDFFDLANSAGPYTTFLAAHNPAIPGPVIDAVGAGQRPDIISHRPGATPEWYEIKPLSPAGVAAGLTKGNTLVTTYAANGLPYRPGKTYRPSGAISLGKFVTPEGERLELVCEVRRLLPGLLFYRLCLRGDYVRYFNRVRLVAGILAIIAALAPELLALGAAAEEVAEFGAAVRAAAEALGVGALPAVTATP
ncbi:peptidoglycan-binding domain-containing protein [Amycolatopsis jejuensis]|uniref:peptidoglycan-binding domain-containing protein n=1 Tax=Amycolatopsis jejuensis TaxID=330084 RepID=UPI0005247DF6|nr:peptidoglycan-binding protein [Amycolatopsis jejuensis]